MNLKSTQKKKLLTMYIYPTLQPIKEHKTRLKTTFGMPKALYPFSFLYPSIVPMLAIHNVVEVKIGYVQYYVSLCWPLTC